MIGQASAGGDDRPLDGARLRRDGVVLEERPLPVGKQHVVGHAVEAERADELDLGLGGIDGGEVQLGQLLGPVFARTVLSFRSAPATFRSRRNRSEKAGPTFLTLRQVEACCSVMSTSCPKPCSRF